MLQSEIDEWANALESGEYEQGRSRLCRTDQHGIRRWCCLGVKADLDVKAGRYGVRMTVPADAPDVMEYGTTWQHTSRTRLVYWGNLGLPHLEDELIRMNDSEHRTFREIAAWIRANVQATD